MFLYTNIYNNILLWKICNVSLLLLSSLNIIVFDDFKRRYFYLKKTSCTDDQEFDVAVIFSFVILYIYIYNCRKINTFNVMIYDFLYFS